jgi:acyl-CoA dehydrogenase
MTEPGAGTNSAAIRTTARKKGSDYYISGNKAYISHGDIAEIIYVVAKTGPGGWEDMTVFAVEGDARGVERRRINILGQPSAGLGEIFFDEVAVPPERIIGEVGGARPLVSPTVVLDRVQIAARALAQAELAFALALEHAKGRIVADNKPLFDFQHTQMRLAEMSIDIEVGVAVLEHTLAKLRVGECRPRDAAVAKVAVTEMSARVVDAAVQLFGAAGVADEYPISGIYAANRVFRILAGTSELLKLSLAQKL